MVFSKTFIMKLYTCQKLGEKGRFQIDRMVGLNRPVGNRLEGYGSVGTVKKNFTSRSSGATGGDDQAEQDQQDVVQRSRKP